MNQTEKVGWIGMVLGLIVTALPFIPIGQNGSAMNVNPNSIIVSILGLCIFLIGAAKALPEVLFATFGHKDKSSNDISQKESTKE